MRTSKLISATALLVVVLVLSAGFAIAAPPPGVGGNGGWSEKVTGGGDASAGSTDFSLTMSAADERGQFQYHREGQTVADLTMHGVIDCVFVADDLSYAVLSGVVTHAPVPAGGFVEGADVTIAVKEGGNGAGDQVRIWQGPECGPYGGGYPGRYFDGNINIRRK